MVDIVVQSESTTTIVVIIAYRSYEFGEVFVVGRTWDKSRRRTVLSLSNP